MFSSSPYKYVLQLCFRRVDAKEIAEDKLIAAGHCFSDMFVVLFRTTDHILQSGGRRGSKHSPSPPHVIMWHAENLASILYDYPDHNY